MEEYYCSVTHAAESEAALGELLVPMVTGCHPGRAEATMDQNALSYEDGQIIGNTALDVIAEITERWTTASLILVRIELIVEAEGQVHAVARMARGARDQPSGSGKT
ncbi:MAG TPA: hypothetical protein VFW09_16070 [Solirubrobacteraceae bacterium]|nr:hypothetical protein [Solirubrobacteraceae bacterium]